MVFKAPRCSQVSPSPACCAWRCKACSTAYLMWTAYERAPGQFDVLGKNCLGADASMRHGIGQTRHFITLRAGTEAPHSGEPRHGSGQPVGAPMIRRSAPLSRSIVISLASDRACPTRQMAVCYPCDTLAHNRRATHAFLRNQVCRCPVNGNFCLFLFCLFSPEMSLRTWPRPLFYKDLSKI